ncbi:hypothetical protein TNIN_2861 [Trichonephila inaurata madagascariensis]|uniref:Uncharacterized protein n=1 Tax=Trichonephila inaurata madagascariensis TaxID=2747483 RepID=A0A8X6X4X6_9ARAC|nr:hypothetical protein TNIN_2861 [Trichonephila inaurata madagascariensis]
MPPQCYRCQEFFTTPVSVTEPLNVLNAAAAISPQNVKNQPNPQLNVQTAADLIQQNFQDAPTTQSTGNNIKTNPKTTSGRRKPRRAPKKPHHNSKSHNHMPRQWRKYHT